VLEINGSQRILGDGVSSLVAERRGGMIEPLADLLVQFGMSAPEFAYALGMTR
jgi:hypothetical protein